MYVKDQPGKWEDYLHLADFAYNNNYQSSSKFSPFEILYYVNARLLSPGIIQ